LIRYWYWVDGEFTASPYRAKLLFARSKLLGGIQGAAVIAIAASYDHDAGVARSEINDFLAHSAPIGDLLLAADKGSGS
jgi:EpsI family protein